MITAFIKKPGVPGTVEIIDASLDSLQKIVGGYIEAVYIDDFALVVNARGSHTTSRWAGTTWSAPSS